MSNRTDHGPCAGAMGGGVYECAGAMGGGG